MDLRIRVDLGGHFDRADQGGVSYQGGFNRRSRPGQIYTEIQIQMDLNENLDLRGSIWRFISWGIQLDIQTREDLNKELDPRDLHDGGSDLCGSKMEIYICVTAD